MKTSKVQLIKWLPSEGENIEIDWPKVHKTIGIDHTNWLLNQDRSQCQLILERTDIYCQLVAEFYDTELIAVYHLMWAK